MANTSGKDRKEDVVFMNVALLSSWYTVYLWVLCVLMVAVSLCPNDEHCREVLMLTVTCNQLLLNNC